MVARDRSDSTGARRLAVRLHDASAGLAVGVGLLKGWTQSERGDRHRESQLAIEAFEQVLADLRELSQAVWHRAAVSRRPADLAESLRRDAEIANVELELKVIGTQDWLSAQQLELIRLAGREAIRNVKRHSGAVGCRLTIDVSSCPFVLTARDWGAGILPGRAMSGGISLLEELAEDMGALLTISSQPGLGTELRLIGPACVVSRGALPSIDIDGRLRSVVANESARSRRRVAPTRPLGASGQQIK